jgi:glycosyltransferase involved in cell wall biosynthesis
VPPQITPDHPNQVHTRSQSSSRRDASEVAGEAKPADGPYTARRVKVGFEVIVAGSVLGAGQGGASGYIEGLLPGVLDDERVEELVAYVADWYEPAADWRHPKLTVRRWPVPKFRPARVAFEQLALPPLATRDRLDVLFSTSNYRPLRYRSPNVVALHAVQHFLLDGGLSRSRGAYLKFAVPRSVRSADMVVAVTDTLRRDAIRLFDLDPDRVVTVHMGPSPWALELLDSDLADIEPYRTPDGSPYVLSISRLYALKNHRRLIEAFAVAAREGSLQHKLVVVGGDADVTRAELAEVARAVGVEERVLFLGRVPQEQVPGLYRGADAVAYVSLYETFGHPVLEAFATGAPVITSTAGATGEVAGGAARLVDPSRIDDIAAGLREVLSDRERRDSMRAAGFERVRDFSWESCARGTVDALERAVRLRAA